MFMTRSLQLKYRLHSESEFELTAPVVYDHHGIAVVAPTGFITDLASIPRIFQSLIPKMGKHMMAAVVHDYLYARKGNVGRAVLSRAECDHVFLEAMADAGVDRLTRYTMYWAVRSAGWAVWRNK